MRTAPEYGDGVLGTLGRARQDWEVIGVLFGSQYVSKFYSGGFGVGLANVRYDIDTPIRQLTASVGILGFVTENQFMLTETLGIGVDGMFWGPDPINIYEARAGIRWYPRGKLAVAVDYTFAMGAYDTKAIESITHPSPGSSTAGFVNSGTEPSFRIGVNYGW